MLPTSLAILALSSAAAAQTTWYVDDDGVAPGSGTQQDPYTSIQYAIDQAATASGDLILVAPGTYVGPLVVQFPKLVEVRSSDGPLVTHVRLADGAPPAFVVTLFGFGDGTDCVLDGFTVHGTLGAPSSGVNLDGATLRNSVVVGHARDPLTLKWGLGIHSEGFESFVERCTVVQCAVGANNTGSHYIADLVVGSSVLTANELDLDADGTALYLEHCAWSTQTGTPSGVDNLVGDAGLWNATQGDPRLGPFSVCIDSGNSSLPTDPDGSPADRGAIPYDAGYVPTPTFHCSAEAHSGGCAAPISLKGGTFASVSALTQFRIEATQVLENTPGILIYGTSGRTSLPFFGGELCVLGPIQRTPGQLSNDVGPGPCKGFFVFDFNAWLHTPIGAQIEPGTMVNAQYWFRDNGDLPWGAATSDAVEFAVAP